MKYFSLSQQWVLLLVALLLLGAIYLRFYHQAQPVPSEGAAKEIVVEVSGEVRQPGIYLFKESPNLAEVIQRAGGLKESAPLDTTSSSRILETGTLLTVLRGFSEKEKSEGPLLEEQRDGIRAEIKIRIGRMASNKLLAFSIPLDLNLVSFEDLCLIPGIGESLAREILSYREKRKAFRSVKELRQVRGVGEKKYKEVEGFLAAE